MGSIRSWPNVWEDEGEDGAENERASTDGEDGAEKVSMSSIDCTVNVMTSSDGCEDVAEKVVSSSDDGWLSTTLGRGLN